MKSFVTHHFNTILILFLLFLTDDTLLFGTNINQIFFVSKYIFYIIFITICIIKNQTLIISALIFSKIKVFLLLIILVLFCSIYNDDFRFGNLLVILTLLMAICYTNVLNFTVFKQKFINVIYYFSVFSLIIYIINIFTPTVLNIFPIVYNYGEVGFRTMLVSNVFLSGNELRNTGIFREPGVFAIYLNLAIIFSLFGDLSKRKVAVLIVALLTTASTAGILVLFLVLLLYFFINRNFKNFFILIFLSTALISILISFPQLSEFLFAKLSSSNKDYMSSLSRLSSLLTPIEIIKESPIIGVGLTKFVHYYELFSLQTVGFSMKADSTSTNTFLNTFAIFGSIYGVITLKLYYNLCKIIVKRKAIFLLIIIFILFSSQDLRYSLLFLVLLSYGIVGNFQSKTK